MGVMAGVTAFFRYGVATMRLDKGLSLAVVAGKAESERLFCQEIFLRRSMCLVTGQAALLFQNTMHHFPGEGRLVVATETGIIDCAAEEKFII